MTHGTPSPRLLLAAILLAACASSARADGTPGEEAATVNGDERAVRLPLALREAGPSRPDALAFNASTTALSMPSRSCGSVPRGSSRRAIARVTIAYQASLRSFTAPPMMTLTSAPDYAKDRIWMNAVDTGWVTDEDPAAHATRKRDVLDFQPPLDVVDGAARVLDPLFVGLLTGAHPWGKFWKDYAVTSW